MRLSEETFLMAMVGFVAFIVLLIVWMWFSVDTFSKNMEDFCRGQAHLQGIHGLQENECPPHVPLTR